jgi:hypothetical protein
MVTGLFLLFYGLARISLENVREPDRDMPHFPLGLTMGMMLSAPMVLAGIGLILYARSARALASPAVPEPAISGTQDLPPEAPSDPMQGLAPGAAEAEGPLDGPRS